MDKVALISSVLAILAALITGIFSLGAAKKTAKAQKLQNYLLILHKKEEKLTEYIRNLMVIGKRTSAITDVKNTYEHIWEICEKESHLFTECEEDFLRLDLKRKQVKQLWEQASQLAGQGRADLMELAMKNTIEFIEAFDRLMKDERMATVQKINNLAIE